MCPRGEGGDRTQRSTHTWGSVEGEGLAKEERSRAPGTERGRMFSRKGLGINTCARGLTEGGRSGALGQA